MTENCFPGTSLEDLLDSDALTSIIQGSSDLPYSEVLATSSKCMAGGLVIRARQNQNVNIELQVKDINGYPINLNQNDPAPPQPVVLIAKERYNSESPSITVVATVQPGTDGIITLTLTPSDLATAGLFYAQVVVLSTDLSENLSVTDYWLEIAPGLNANSCGPITIAELRMELRDVCGEQNFLLGDVEFSDDEIAYAIAKPLDEFNESFVPLTNYNATTFPYRFNWRRAATGYLLQTAGWHYERNNLRYNAGDVSVNDKDKFAAYNREAIRILTEWRDFIAHTKMRLNARRAWGYSESPLRQ